MSPDPDFAAAAALLAEPARAAILTRLLDGRSWTATELAKAADIRPATGSAHLAKLRDVGWVDVHAQGRYRYYHLANPEVAAFLESFARLAPPKEARTPGERRASLALRHCRLCYDHLAGRVGVALGEALVARGFVQASGGAYTLTPEGRQWAEGLGLEIPAEAGKPCMDWSERRLHLAGPLGRDLAAALLQRRWFQRDPRSRALWVTPEGAQRLKAELDISCQEDEV